MQNGEQLSLEQIQAFMEGSQEVHFGEVNRQGVYGWITATGCGQEYWAQNREVKGLLRRYMTKTTQLSRGSSQRRRPKKVHLWDIPSARRSQKRPPRPLYRTRGTRLAADPDVCAGLTAPASRYSIQFVIISSSLLSPQRIGIFGSGLARLFGLLS
jgi:hypothetical protein